jgi:hypothetical protein
VVGCVGLFVVRALALAGVVIGLSATGAIAGPGGYCDAYAKHFAGRKTGLAGGAASTPGSVDAVGSPEAATSWRGVYEKTFAECMSAYGAAEVGAVVETTAPKAKQDSKKQTSSCASRYRSFNPKTGRYKSYSGEWRPCR